MPQDRTEVSVEVAGLEERGICRDVFLANDAAKEGEGANRTNQWTLVVLGEGDFLATLSALDSLGEVEREANTRDIVKHLVGDVSPAEEAHGVDGVVFSFTECAEQLF